MQMNKNNFQIGSFLSNLEKETTYISNGFYDNYSCCNTGGSLHTLNTLITVNYLLVATSQLCHILLVANGLECYTFLDIHRYRLSGELIIEGNFTQ